MEENVEIVRRAFAVVQDSLRRDDPGAAFDACVLEGIVASNLEWRAGMRGGTGVAGMDDFVGRRGFVEFMRTWTEEFEGWSTGAMWEDTKLGLKDPRVWEKIALVSDKDWVKHTVKALGWMVPGEVRVFELDELDAAKVWAAN